MHALEEYNSLIHLRKQLPLPQGEYGEVHHIIPKSCNGPEEAWNKVRLTPEEHYRAHFLLTFIYATGDEHKCMVKAWGRLHHDGKRKVEISEVEYGKLRRELSRAHKGKPGTFKGKHHSEEVKRRISRSHMGLPSPNKGRRMGAHTDEWRRKVSEALKGKKFTEEHKRRIAEANRRRKVSEETRRKMSESHKRRWGALHGQVSNY